MVEVRYDGGERLRIDVRGHEVIADQPVEDGGEDAGPTPTELFVAGLGACIAHYAQRFLRRHGLSTDGLAVTCDYSWAENPHRVGAIAVELEAPGLPPERRAAFERVIEHCTVHNSLRVPPEIRVSVGRCRTAAA